MSERERLTLACWHQTRSQSLDACAAPHAMAVVLAAAREEEEANGAQAELEEAALGVEHVRMEAPRLPLFPSLSSLSSRPATPRALADG